MNLSIKAGLLAAVVICLLSACGGGGGAASTGTLGGKAAVGFPIVAGTVSVVCSGGGRLASTTDIAGAWLVTLSGQTLPCAVEVTGGTINGIANSLAYHSVAMSFGTVNVTPLSDLLVANLAGTNPTTWFAGLNANSLAAINSSALSAALTRLRAALPALAALVTIDPITLPFIATSGNAIDDMLSALRAALANSGVSYASLLSAATASTITPPAGLGAALTTAYSGTSTGGGSGNGGGSTGCTGAVSAFFVANARTATGSITTYNGVPNATPTVLGAFANGTTTPVIVNSNCTITVGAYTLTAVNVTFFYDSVGNQYDVDMTGTGVAHGHFEKFANGTSLLGFSNPANSDSAQFSLP